MKTLLTALCLAGATTIALAAPMAASVGTTPKAPQEERHGLHKHGHHGGRADQAPLSYTETSVRTLDDGRQFKRETRQVVSEHGLSRQTTLTRPDGKTARRDMQRRYDPAMASWVRSVKGSDFDGKAYAHESTGPRGKRPARAPQDWAR